MKKILVPVDFSDITATLVKIASEQAKAFGAKLHLLHVEDPNPDFVGYEPGPQTQRDSVAHDIHHYHEELKTIEKNLQREGINVSAFSLQGPTVETIFTEAEKSKVDLIVIGTHGHGALHHLLVGSVTKNIIQKSNIPVLLVSNRTVKK